MSSPSKYIDRINNLGQATQDALDCLFPLNLKDCADFDFWLHCDDIGVSSESVNKIWPLYESGALGGASVFANGPGSDEFIAKANMNTAIIRVAAHLSLTNGPSVLPKEDVDLLVDDRGLFKHGFIWFLFAGIFHSKKNTLQLQIRRELVAQVQKLRPKVRPACFLGLNGHNHVHAIPYINRILKLQFPELRCRLVFEPIFFSHRVRDHFSFRFVSNWPKILLLRILHYINDGPKISQRGCLGVIYSGIQSVAAIGAGVAQAKKMGMSELEVIIHSLQVSVDDHEGNIFGADLVTFLRHPARAQEAKTAQETFEAIQCPIAGGYKID